MNTDGGWVLPLVIEPEESICFQINVPNDVFHLAAFKGALWELTRWYNWARNAEHTAIEVADVWKGIYEAVHSGDNCEMGTFDIRQKPDAPCIIQKQPYGDTWVDSVNIQLCPPQVRVNNGVVQWFNPDTGLWENVETGDERSNGTAPVPWPSPPIGETGNCLAAENITAYYQSVLTSVRGDVALGKSVTIIATLVTSALSLFIPPMLYGTLALGLASAALTLTEVGLDIMLQEEHIDNFKCVIFCNAESDGSITTSAFTAIRDGMAGWASGLELSIIQYYLDSLGSVGLQRQGAALGITTGHCDDCDCDECPFVDFVEANYTAILGAVGSGNGMDGGNALESTTLDGSDGIQLEFSTDTSNCEYTQITFWAYIDWSSPYARNIQFEIRDATETVLQSGTVAVTTPERAWYQRTIPVTVTVPPITHLWLRTGAEGQAGLFKVTEVAFNVV